MRNPIPLLLVVLLAIIAIGLSLRGPKTPPPEPTALTTTSGQHTETTDPAENGTSPTIAPRPWPTDSSDIRADPQAVFGQLPNGLQYIILPNNEPPNRISLRLHVAAGSLMENDDQQGLAHFLEHMVFNGTKNHKDANQLINEMQRRGIAFGAHANAYTSFDETVYMLDLPDLNQDTLDLAFTVMRDFCDGALLENHEIDSERGVILAEKASRDSVSFRMMQKQFAALLPESLITKRFPIGEEEIIKNAPRERFVEFYETFYVPENMTFIVVGNIDPAEYEVKIEQTFSSLKTTGEPIPQPNLGTITEPEGIVSHAFHDRELTSTDVSLTLVRPFEREADTTANRSDRLPLDIAHAIINRRFERLSRVENTPVASGSAYNSQLFNQLELGSISITAADDRWKEALPVLEQEFRRTLQHGFSDAELAEAKANLINAYEQSVKRKDTRKSEQIATSIARSINDQTVFSTPETNLEIVSAALENIDTNTVHQAFITFWQSPGHHLILSTKETEDDEINTLSALYQESSTIDVEPPAARATEPFAYTDFGPPGTITATTQIEDFDTTQITLSNNIRLNLKATPYEQNRIRLLARIGSGKLSQPKDTPFLDGFASALFDGGGLGKHSNDDLSEILAGRNVSNSLSIGEDAFTLSGSTTPSDLELQLQLMVASITDPGYRNEALWQFQKSIPMIYQSLRHTTAGPQQEMNAWLHGGDFRYSIPSQTQLSNYTTDQVRDWLTPQLTKGYLELTIVGDFQQDELLPKILATFGALPKRDASPADPSLDVARKINFPAPPTQQTFTYESEIPQAIATAIWKTNGIRNNIPEFRRLNILADIYGDRLRAEIREELGASYSPNAGAAGSPALDNVGYLIGQSVGKPEDLPLLLETMKTLAADLAENGADQDELDRALAPTLGQLERTLRDNTYWLNTVLSQSQEDPSKLELARNRDADYRSITLQEISTLAKKYLNPQNLHQISILPKP